MITRSLSFCLQVIFWLLNRPACFIVHLVLLPTRHPASVKIAPRGVSCARMPSSANAVTVAFTWTMDCVLGSVRGAFLVFSFLDLHMNVHHHNTSVMPHSLILSLPLSQRISSRWCLPSMYARVCILPREFLLLSKLWITVPAAGPLLQVTLFRGLLCHKERMPSLSSSL